MNHNDSSFEVVEEKIEEDIIDESFEEILSGYKIEDEDNESMLVETEPLCASCYEPLDVDVKQTVAYCEKCEATVFVHRRYIDSSLKDDCSL